jgi:hypothetical protein
MRAKRSRADLQMKIRERKQSLRSHMFARKEGERCSMMTEEAILANDGTWT